MQRLRFLTLFSLVVLLLAFSAVPAFAAGTVLIVDDSQGTSAACPGAKFKTIQDALKAAPEGATIKICPGDYQGGIEITKKGLKLVATPALQARISRNGLSGFVTGITVRANGVRLEGLDVSGVEFGIDVFANNVVVRKNNVHDNKDVGISTFKMKNGSVSENTVLRNGVGSVNTGGMLIEFGSGTEVQKNTVSNNRGAGIILREMSSAHVALNTVTDNTLQGFQVCNGSTGNLVELNTASTNGRDGILVDEPGFSFCDVGAAASVTNIFKQNTMQSNGVLDARDISKGSGTAGTANTWTTNICVSSNPLGLCGS